MLEIILEAKITRTRASVTADQTGSPRLAIPSPTGSQHVIITNYTSGFMADKSLGTNIWNYNPQERNLCNLFRYWKIAYFWCLQKVGSFSYWSHHTQPLTAQSHTCVALSDWSTERQVSDLDQWEDRRLGNMILSIRTGAEHVGAQYHRFTRHSTPTTFFKMKTWIVKIQVERLIFLCKTE